MQMQRIAAVVCLGTAAVACLLAVNRVLLSPMCDTSSAVLPDGLCRLHPTHWARSKGGYAASIYYQQHREAGTTNSGGEGASASSSVAAAETSGRQPIDAGPHAADVPATDARSDALAAQSGGMAAAGVRTAAGRAASDAQQSQPPAQRPGSPKTQPQQPNRKQPSNTDAAANASGSTGDGSANGSDTNGSSADNGAANDPKSASSSGGGGTAAPSGAKRRKGDVQKQHPAEGTAAATAMRLPPVREIFGGQEVIWEKPRGRAKGLFLLLNGCNHGADGWWDPQPACPNCLRLPEEKAIVKAGIERGYVVIALSVVQQRNKMRCWANLRPPNSNRDMKSTVSSVRKLVKREKWGGLPVYAWGGSAGGSFVARLPYYYPLKGIMVQLKAIKPAELDVIAEARDGWTHPPVIYAYNRRDPVATQRAKDYTSALKSKGIEFVLLAADPRPLTPTFFSDRIEEVNSTVSQQLYAAFKNNGLLDDHDYLITNPRHTDKQWQPLLRAEVPYTKTVRLERYVSPIFEELNWAFSDHQGISDCTAASFEFFETGKRPDAAMLENPQFWELQNQQDGNPGT